MRAEPIVTAPGEARADLPPPQTTAPKPHRNLETCQTCGHTISRYAAACPACGEPGRRPPPNPVIRGFVSELFALLFGLWQALMIVWAALAIGSAISFQGTFSAGTILGIGASLVITLQVWASGSIILALIAVLARK